MLNSVFKLQVINESSMLKRQFIDKSVLILLTAPVIQMNVYLKGNRSLKMAGCIA